MMFRYTVLILSLGFSTWAAQGGPGGGGYTPETAPLVATALPKQLKNVGIKEKLGDQVDLNMTFKDETGKTVQLSQYIDGTKPVIISPVYYSCPRLCNFHLNGLTEALKKVNWNPGQKFQVVAVSFDSKEKPELAAEKKASFMKIYNRPGTEAGWHFLTGDDENIKKLTQGLGFEFQWDPETQEWSHASAAIVVSPMGKITRYLPGIVFDPKNVKLALTEAGEGKVGNFVDSLVLYCFHYDPHKSKYTLAAFKLMRFAGTLMAIILAIWLLPVWIRTWKADNPRSK